MNFHHPNLPFRDNASGALSYLLRQSQLHTAALEAVYRQQAIPLRTLAQGVLLQHTQNGDLLLSVESNAALTVLLASLPAAPGRLILHQEWAVEALLQRLPQTRPREVAQWYYPNRDMPRFTVPFDVGPLDSGDVQDALVCDPTLPVPVFREQIENRRVFGACIHDALAGTIGLGPEGGVDWLAVRPDLRRQGIGTALLQWMLRQELHDGHVPFALVNGDNVALATLFNRVGMVAVQQKLYILE